MIRVEPGGLWAAGAAEEVEEEGEVEEVELAVAGQIVDPQVARGQADVDVDDVVTPTERTAAVAEHADESRALVALDETGRGFPMMQRAVELLPDNPIARYEYVGRLTMRAMQLEGVGRAEHAEITWEEIRRQLPLLAERVDQETNEGSRLEMKRNMVGISELIEDPRMQAAMIGILLEEPALPDADELASKLESLRNEIEAAYRF